MYSRSYYPDSERMSLPENYDGTAFMERQIPQEDQETVEAAASDNTEDQVFKVTNGNHRSRQSSFENSPILSGIFGKGGLLGDIGIHMPTIGTEEILILATAAFLFFSKSGDRECALILLLLLFIG